MSPAGDYGNTPADLPGFLYGGKTMPKIFTTLDKIKPAYDITYKVVLFICKLLLIADIIITVRWITVLSSFPVCNSLRLLFQADVQTTALPLHSIRKYLLPSILEECF